MIESVLVVCTGNICRSPMAEGLLKNLLPDLRVMSAGLEALTGFSADPIAVELMMSRGVDIAHHRARQLESWMCRDFDLILVMENLQKRLIENQFPFARGKVFSLQEPNAHDVRDPYRRGREAFESSLKEIEVGLELWAAKLRRIANVSQ